MTMLLQFPQSLAEKYRPRKLADFVGVHRPRKIMMAFAANPFPQNWFLLGASGLGKTSMAQAVSEEIGAELHHIPSRSCDLEAIEYACRLCNYIPMVGHDGFHVILVDEADQMTAAAQLALLSKLDSTDRPPRTIFFFTANSRLLLEQRFMSRCRVLEFEPETLESELAAYLRKVYKAEGGRLPLAFDKIARDAQHNVRDALGKLELELLLGSDRSDLPEEKPKPEIVTHTHACEQCGKAWPHTDNTCRLRYRSDCPQCGGATSLGTERARKAWKTMRAKQAAEIEAAKKSARKRRRRKAA